MSEPVSALPAPTADEQVEFEALDTFVRALPQGLGLGFVPLAVSTAVLRAQTDSKLLLPWAGVVAAVLVVGLLVAANYRRSAPQTREIARWRRRFMLYVALAGAAWGSVAWLLMPASPEVELILFLLLAALAASIMADLAANPALFAALVIPLLAPLAVAFFLQGSAVGLGLGFGEAMFLVVLLVFSRRTAGHVRHAMRVGHLNERLAQKLAERTREAEQASLAKSRFLAAASHDLRQPVHALGLLLDVLQGQALNAAQQGTAQRMERVLDALALLFEGLLDISRLDSGMVEPRVTEFALRPLLLRLADEYRAETEAKGLRLGCHAGDAWVRSDPVLLERMLRNLLANAVRYTRRGGIVIGARGRGERVDIEVWDSGIGIAADAQEHVFDEFFQVANPQRDRGEGLGLGLAIVRRLGELMRHPVTLRSRPGHGSVLRIAVPRVPARRHSAMAPAGAEAASTEPGRHVLIVEDDGLVREALRGWLASWGCEVTACANADELLGGLDALPAAPDALIADWRLPGGRDGLALAQQVQQRFGGELPVVLITGDAVLQAPQVEHLRRATLMHKPVRPAELRAAFAASWQRPPGQSAPEVDA